MKIYVPSTEKTPQQEMHLSVDHGLYPVELDEDELTDIIWNCVGRQTPMSKHESDMATKAILQYIEEKGQG